MANALDPTWISAAAVLLNGAVLMWCGRIGRIVPRTALRCTAFALLTLALFHAHTTPTQTPDTGAPAVIRFVQGAVQIVWWLLAASTATLLVRVYYAIDGQMRQARLTLDVVETAFYLTAGVAIITDVFDIPLKGVLATSGALAIVLGLALQSTLADLFSGIVINATAPFRVGDQIMFDDGTEGIVREITWRATHLLKRNHDLIVVPNSSIAKSRIVNTSMPVGAHATIVGFQAKSAYRPSLVLSALRLAAESCVGIDMAMPVHVVTKSVGWEATDYEASFFVMTGRSGEDTVNTFFDAAQRHLDALSMLAGVREGGDVLGGRSIARKFVDGIGVFGLLSEEEKSRLASAMVVRELAPGDVLVHEGEVPTAVSVVGYGVINAATRRDGVSVDVMRFSPGEYFGESGPIAGVALEAELSAKTHAVVFDLPAAAVAVLLRQHRGLSRALAAKLAERERRGEALIQKPPDVPTAHHGLVAWLEHAVHMLHGLRV